MQSICCLNEGVRKASKPKFHISLGYETRLNTVLPATPVRLGTWSFIQDGQYASHDLSHLLLYSK